MRAIVLIGSDSLAFTREEKLEFEEILNTWCNSDNIDKLSKDCLTSAPLGHIEVIA